LQAKTVQAFLLERYFMVFIIVGAILALSWPQVFLGLKGWIPFGLGIVIFSIGVHTSARDLIQPFTKPGRVLGLVLIRYACMPGIAYLIAYGFDLKTPEIIGLLVLGTAPGGVAANVMAYLAKANVSLTVLLTIASTLLSPFLTPILIYAILHQKIEINFFDMVSHIGMIIFIPIGLGLFCNRIRHPMLGYLKKGLPYCAMLMVVMIVATIVAWNQTALLQFPLMLIAAVLVLNGLGYVIGAIVGYVLCLESKSIMAVVFDYGMFDGAIAIMICTMYFGAHTALPAVLLGIIQNMTAPLLIRYWQHKKLISIQRRGGENEKIN
jgi:BASS family bile acid:Na+ symporter